MARDEGKGEEGRGFIVPTDSDGFGALGAARDSLEEALTYATERHQFNQPIVSYQLTQEKLANMAFELNKGQLWWRCPR